MKKKFKVSQIRDLLNQVYNEKITFSRFVEILNEQAETKDIKDLISTIKVDKANLEHIAQTGKINGSLLTEIERIIKATW
jgi:hypothetical protein